MSRLAELAPEISIEGKISDLDPGQRARLLERDLEVDATVATSVAEIVDAVAARGDQELYSLAERFDATSLASIEVAKNSWREALNRLPPDLISALETARDRIEAFHRRQVPTPDESEIGPGIHLGRRPEALRVVGAYAPGGRAAYPSSVLMCVVPARLAGVGEIVVCSPPGPSGAPADVVLAACELAGADRLFALGGAGAVAALAYGTESVPRAEKIVGPGNVYVTEAKRQLSGLIESDCHAGPSELLVIGDADADPEVIGREMLAQAEHDPAAIAVAVVPQGPMRTEVRAVLGSLASEQPRRQTIHEALRRNGALLEAGDLDEALSFASSFAPEHLLLLVQNPREAMARVSGAGSIFLGATSSVAFGDYLSGTNHVLPTGGFGRRQSGLGVADFVRWCSYQEVDPAGAASLAEPTATIADAEGLDAHAAAARAWASDHDATARSAGRAPVHRRPEYASLTTYDPGRRPVEIDLSDNTNLFGQAPSARAVLESLEANDMRRYPSLYGGELKSAAAAYFGVDEACIATGCGSDDLIDSAIRAFCGPGDSVAFSRPTFSMIEAFARMNGVSAVGTDLLPGFELSAEDLATLQAQVTYICRPNNPTGNAGERAEVERLVDRAAGLVIIDEAYGDFFADPLVAWAPQTDRAVVFRTMSKAFGLAGLRVGIAVGPPPLIEEIEKSRGPYKVAAASELAAAAALRNDREWLCATVAEALEAREYLTRALTELGLEVYPSAANFVLVAAPHDDAMAYGADLANAGIGVRPFPRLPHAGDCVRITVAPIPSMERLVARTKEIIER